MSEGNSNKGELKMLKLQKYGKRFYLNLNIRKGWVLAGFSASKSILKSWKNMGLI